MTREPVSLKPQNASGAGQLIALYLERLMGYLLRIEGEGRSTAPPDIARMVASTESLIFAFIRMLAADQLTRAGFTEVASAMRDVAGEQPAAKPRAALEVASPAELISRLRTMVETFNQAEDYSSALARMIVCALVYVSGGAGRSARLATRRTAKRPEINMVHGLGFGQPPINPVGRGPPFQIPGLRPGQLSAVAHLPINCFPGAHSSIRDPEIA
ncbi:MAG: hypothetical protein CMK07_04545 [Ponticaulis sp.]|nr:hypothetical protein [Ponticaulis sp.]